MTACPCHGFTVAPDLDIIVDDDGSVLFRIPGDRPPPFRAFEPGAHIPLDDRCLLIGPHVAAAARGPDPEAPR